MSWSAGQGDLGSHLRGAEAEASRADLKLERPRPQPGEAEGLEGLAGALGDLELLDLAPLAPLRALLLLELDEALGVGDDLLAPLDAEVAETERGRGVRVAHVEVDEA